MNLSALTLKAILEHSQGIYHTMTTHSRSDNLVRHGSSNRSLPAAAHNPMHRSLLVQLCCHWCQKHITRRLHQLQVDLTCLQPALGADAVRIVVIGRQQISPLMSALVKMPISEVDV